MPSFSLRWFIFVVLISPPRAFPFSYTGTNISALREAVSNLSSGNVEAVRAASFLLAAISFPTDRLSKQSGLWVTNWMAFSLGRRNFRTPPPPSSIMLDVGNTPADSRDYCLSEISGQSNMPIAVRNALSKCKMQMI